MNITEKEWLTVYDKLDAMTKTVKGILFNVYRWKWNPSAECVRDYVWDQTLKRLESYRPGPASPATYVQKYVPKDVVRRFVKEYHMWQTQVDCDKIEDLPDFKETPAQACVKNDLVQTVLETASDDTQKALALFAEGHTLDEIGEKLGVDKSAVLKRFRKLGEEINQ